MQVIYRRLIHLFTYLLTDGVYTSYFSSCDPQIKVVPRGGGLTEESLGTILS